MTFAQSCGTNRVLVKGKKGELKIMDERDKKSQERILVVEDAENWREMLGMVLRRKGDVVVVSSVEEAQKALGQGGFTRIICDGLEGDYKKVYEAAKKAGVPLKILSSSDSVKEQAEELRIEFVDKSKIDIDSL